MLKSALIFFLALGFCISCFGQHAIKGKVMNENGAPLSYATVALLHQKDSTLMYFGVTNDRGVYEIKPVKPGNYLMQFSFVGMDTDYDNVKVPSTSSEDFGDKILSPSTLEEVIVEAELIPIKFKSDTLEYEAKSFKTRPGAVVEELLERLPGVEVDESGNIKAQGEEVVKVLVDGKEFFDKDPKVATKNLPAKALDKVQVYDRKSEEAAFSGIDDGVRERTINLLLNEHHKKGYFGNVTAALGSDENYKAEGRIYRFSSTVQTAVLGMYNNINEFGFTHKGNDQFGQGTKGLNTSLAGGLNLSYNTDSNNRYFFSYLGNSRKKELEEQISTENFLLESTYNQLESLLETEKDKPHKANFGARHNFDKNNKLIFDGDVELALNDVFSHSSTDSKFEENLISNLDNHTINHSTAVKFNSKAVYITKFKENKTQFKTNLFVLYTQNESSLDWTNISTSFDPFGQITVDQFRNNDTDKLRLSTSPTFVQKIGKFWSLEAGAMGGLDNENINRGEGVLDPTGEFIEFSIPHFRTKELFAKPFFSVRHTKKKTRINFSLEAITNQFDKELDNHSVDRSTYFYFLPRLGFQSEYRTGRRFTGRYHTSLNMPSANRLYPVVDSINQFAIYQGNIYLKPEYNHDLTFNWSLFDQFSFTSFFVRLNGRYTQDKISWSQWVNDQFIKTTTPINVDYGFSLNTFMDFTTPLRALGININVRSNESWNRGVVYINEQENIHTNFTHNLGLNIENRNKEKWGIKVGASISLTESIFSVSQSQNNVYFNTNYFSNIRFTPSKKWNFETKANVVNYNSQSFDESVSVPLITANVSYAFLQAEKATIALSGFDLLNKYRGFQRISETNFLMQREWNTLGRYVMLTFRWRIRQ